LNHYRSYEHIDYLSYEFMDHDTKGFKDLFIDPDPEKEKTAGRNASRTGLILKSAVAAAKNI
jgi:hypothetical protein